MRWATRGPTQCATPNDQKILPKSKIFVLGNPDQIEKLKKTKEVLQSGLFRERDSCRPARQRRAAEWAVRQPHGAKWASPALAAPGASEAV